MTASYDVVAFHRTTEPVGSLRVIADSSGVLALVRAEARFGGNFDDPDDHTRSWYSYSVEWCRSGTIYPGGLRSSDLEATCAAVAAWENSVDADRRALIDDYRLAAERAELAAAEAVRDDPDGDSDRATVSQKRALHFLAEKQRLASRLRDALDAVGLTQTHRVADTGVAHARDVPPPAPDRRAGDRQAVDRRAVLDEAVDVINRNGVLLGIRPSLLSTVAAKLHRSEREVSSLWPSSEAMRGDILLALAREGLYNRADDATLISTWNFLASHASDLATRDGRRDVLTRLIALVAQHNFEAVTTSMPWRNYVVCSVGAAESEALSETLTAELRRSENSFLTHMAHFYENVLGQIGFRLNDRLRHNHRAFAVSMAAVIEGLGIVRRSVPDILAATYGGADDADLSIASLLVTVLLDGLIEEDPHYDAEAAIRRLTEGLEFESVEP